LGRAQYRSLGTTLSEIGRIAQYETPIERIDEAAREIATLFIVLRIHLAKGTAAVRDFLIVMGAVVLVVLVGRAYSWFAGPPRNAKRQ
jgi:hypothetical protein